ncbi:MAG: DUF5658 family protein [Candidatus Methanoperedens sp.]
MRRTVQKTLTGEAATRQAVAMQPPVNLTDIIWLPIKYYISTANLQRLLFLLAFLTYGVGDGVTAAYMMDRTGIIREINPVMRFLYASYGAQGVIGIKIWFTFMILFLVWIISRRTNTYWTINGFLSALCVGGFMAVRANLMAAYGMTPPSASSVIMAFLILMVLFVMLGDMMDKLGSTSVKQVRESRTSQSF